jgi:hypothetical protein
VCVFLCLCTGRGLATSWLLVQGVLPTVLDLITEVKRKVSWKRPRPELGCRAKGRKPWQGITYREYLRTAVSTIFKYCNISSFFGQQHFGENKLLVEHGIENAVTKRRGYWRRFGLDIGFIDHFNTQLVITLNYNLLTVFVCFYSVSYFRMHTKHIVTSMAKTLLSND